MQRMMLFAVVGVLIYLPECVNAQTLRIPTMQIPTHDANRAVRPRVDAVQSVPPAIGTAQAPDFFFANAMGCPDIMPPSSVLDLCLQRIPPDGRIYPLAEQQFQNLLKPGVPICVVVHGSFVPASEFETFVKTYQWIRGGAPHLPLHVVFYRWPSSADAGAILPQLQVERLGARADAHGLRLARFLRRLPPQNPVSLLAHSHGTRCASSALHLLAGGRVGPLFLTPQENQKQYRIVFSAAAIDHHWLNPNQRFGRAFESAEAILNLRSRRDWALGLYPLRTSYSEPALGMVGLTPYDRFVLGDVANKFGEVDVTPIVGAGHTERAYYPHVVISRSFAAWLYYTDRTQTADVRGQQKRRLPTR